MVAWLKIYENSYSTSGIVTNDHSQSTVTLHRSIWTCYFICLYENISVPTVELRFVKVCVCVIVKGRKKATRIKGGSNEKWEKYDKPHGHA